MLRPETIVIFSRWCSSTACRRCCSAWDWAACGRLPSSSCLGATGSFRWPGTVLLSFVVSLIAQVGVSGIAGGLARPSVTVSGLQSGPQRTSMNALRHQCTSCFLDRAPWASGGAPAARPVASAAPAGCCRPWPCQVVGVHQQRCFQLLRRTRQSGLTAPARHGVVRVLLHHHSLGHQVHAVAQRVTSPTAAARQGPARLRATMRWI